uniref:NIDO domain-containing protein n=1 Tax=Sparus aurata TaxID=8175 RepID=A0A671TVC0_SPAAU
FLDLSGYIHFNYICIFDPSTLIDGTANPRSDDDNSPLVTLQHPFLYFGRTYEQIYVNQNGHLTFDRPWELFRAIRFPLHRNRDIIAPFWTDLDNRLSGHVFYNQYTSGSVLQQATQDINKYFPGLMFKAAWVFVATWHEVAYYKFLGTVSHLVLNGKTSKTYTHLKY